MTPFFITGLPRTRTAWMSAFLSTGRNLCIHEVLKFCRTRNDFTQLMSRKGRIRYGTADSMLMWSDFQGRFPGAPLVIIERDPEEVIRSLSRISLNAAQMVFESHQRLSQVNNALRVPYDKLDASMPAVCNYLDIPYPKVRHAMFRDLQIETRDFQPRPDALALWYPPEQKHEAG